MQSFLKRNMPSGRGVSLHLRCFTWLQPQRELVKDKRLEYGAELRTSLLQVLWRLELGDLPLRSNQTALGGTLLLQLERFKLLEYLPFLDQSLLDFFRVFDFFDSAKMLAS